MKKEFIGILLLIVLIGGILFIYLNKNNLITGFAAHDYDGENIQKLKLTSMCSSEPSIFRTWRVWNKNNIDVPFNWDVYGMNQNGSGIANANGYVYFNTTTVGGANTVRLFVDGNQHDVKASGGQQCTPTTTLEETTTSEIITTTEMITTIPTTLIETTSEISTTNEEITVIETTSQISTTSTTNEETTTIPTTLIETSTEISTTLEESTFIETTIASENNNNTIETTIAIQDTEGSRGGRTTTTSQQISTTKLVTLPTTRISTTNTIPTTIASEIMPTTIPTSDRTFFSIMGNAINIPVEGVRNNGGLSILILLIILAIIIYLLRKYLKIKKKNKKMKESKDKRNKKVNGKNKGKTQKFEI